MYVHEHYDDNDCFDLLEELFANLVEWCNISDVLITLSGPDNEVFRYNSYYIHFYKFHQLLSRENIVEITCAYDPQLYIFVTRDSFLNFCENVFYNGIDKKYFDDMEFIGAQITDRSDYPEIRTYLKKSG